MKKILLFAALVCCSAFGFQSCDELAKASEITVDMPIKFDINANATTLPNVQTNVVDVSTNSTFNDNKSRLKGVDLSTISMILTDYTGNPAASNALFSKISYTLRFDPIYGDDNVYTIGEFSNVYAADFLNTEKSIDVNNASLNDVLDKLADRPKFVVSSSYTLASGPGTISTMVGKVTMTFKLKAGVL